MKLSGRASSPLAPAALWTELREPVRLANALPGVRLADVIDDRSLRVLIAPATGLGVTPFALDVRIDEDREPSHCRISGAGRSGEHALEFALTIDLAPVAGGSEVLWAADFRFHGVMGSVGQRVLPYLVTDQINAAIAAAAPSEDD